MPRILFLNKSPAYRHTGAEKILWAVGTELAENGWDVHFLTPSGEDPPQIENITYHEVATPDSFFAEKALYFIKGLPKYLQLRKSLNPDIIYDNSSPLPFPYVYFLDSNRTVTKVHAFYGYSSFVNKHHPLTKVGTFVGEQLYRIMDGERMLTISDSTRDRLQDVVQQNAGKITVNRNGIRTENFDYSFSPSGPVLSLCELTPRKNISMLLQAWSLLEDESTMNRQLVIAGDGPSRPKLEELATELGIESVTFRGYVSETTKHQLLQDAFIYVLPTQMEGFGLSNLEAMASGCVTISTNAPGVRDYIETGENGFLVPRDAPDCLANRIQAMLNDPESFEPVAKRGRETAESFHIDDTAERERQILEQYINEKKGD